MYSDYLNKMAVHQRDTLCCNSLNCGRPSFNRQEVEFQEKTMIYVNVMTLNTNFLFFINLYPSDCRDFFTANESIAGGEMIYNLQRESIFTNK